MRIRRHIPLLLLLLALSAVAPPRAAVAQSLEFPIKAQFLYRFVPFVEWPPGAMAAGGPLTLCILGRDPFGGLLDRAVANQRLEGRAFAIRRLMQVEAGSGCHVLYVSASAEQSPAAALQILRGAPVLTITDDAVAAAPHGMIHFVIREQRVRFIIDQGAAEAGGLTISSKLLALGAGA